MKCNICHYFSIMAWYYMTMFDISQALSQTLFRVQSCWKNFSLWRKQQLLDWAHSCQVALTGLSPVLLLPFLFSLKHNTVTAAVQIQEYMSVSNLFPFCCHSHILTHTLHVVWAGFTGLIQHYTGWESPLVRILVWSHLHTGMWECGPTGKGQT